MTVSVDSNKTGLPAAVASASSDIPPFNSTIFNAAGAVTAGADNLLDYTDWAFHVTSITAADSLAFKPSFDGSTTAAAVLMMNMATGAVNAAVTAVGYYRPVIQTAASTYQLLKPMQVRGWFVTKTGVAGTATVVATGGWGA